MMEDPKQSPNNEPDVSQPPEQAPASEQSRPGDDIAAAMADADAAGQVSVLQQQLEDAQNALLRSQAELENFRKRIRREMDMERRYASLPLVSDLLPIIDNLQRAIAAAQQSETSSGLLEGIQMVAGQLLSTLERHGCQPICPQGETFDPNFHEAIAQQPDPQAEPGTVLHVAQTGYQLHDRVVRPAQVVVVAPPPEEPSGD